MMTILEVFEAQVARTPHAVAVRADRTYTYGELSETVAAVQKSIRAHAAAGSLIALDAVGHASGVVGILAAAGSGCAVLPLNRESPAAHRARVLTDARPALLLRETAECTFGVETLPQPREPAMGDIAYVMYTSGSTGSPKGVMVPHTALLDRLAGLASVPGLRAGETIAAMTALSFDISMAEMLLPLTVGGSFAAMPDDIRFDPGAFEDFVSTHAPRVVQATPSFWRTVLAAEWPGAANTTIWCGGEPLTTELARQLLPRCAGLWNLYGPTEATIWATAARVESPEAISLGDPLDGVGLYLAAAGGDGTADLDTPVGGAGAEGEIILYGAGLAHGYLDREALTAERFPVLAADGGGRRVYRTGDRAARVPAGRLPGVPRSCGRPDQATRTPHRTR